MHLQAQGAPQLGHPLPFDDRYVTYVRFDALSTTCLLTGYPDGSQFQELCRPCSTSSGDILKPHDLLAHHDDGLRYQTLQPPERPRVRKINEGKMTRARDWSCLLDMVLRYAWTPCIS